MKSIRQLLPLAILLLPHISPRAQTSTIFEIVNPTGLHIVDDTLYAGAYSNVFVEYPLSGVEDPTILSSFDCYRIAQHERVLYFSDADPNIHTLDLDTDEASTLYSSGSEIFGLEVYDGSLYLAEFGFGKILRIDLDAEPVTPELVVSGLDTITAISQYNDELYITEVRTGSLKKIPLNTASPEISTVFSNEFEAPNELHVRGDYMYISEFTGNKISRFNLLEENPEIESFLIDVLTPTGLASDENFLYVSSFEGDEILKMPWPGIASSLELGSLERPHISPNPSSGSFIVSNIVRDENYLIFNSKGQLVQTGKVGPEEEIEILNSSKQNYILKIGNHLPASMISVH